MLVRLRHTLEDLAVSDDLLDVVLCLREEVEDVDDTAFYQLGQLLFLLFVQYPVEDERERIENLAPGEYSAKVILRGRALDMGVLAHPRQLVQQLGGRGAHL